MTAFWHQHFEYSLFAAGVLLLFGGVHRWVWRGRQNGAIPPLIWLLVFTVLGSGWFFAEGAARRELQGMQRMVEGYAPTYAQELGRMGHQEITLKTSPEDTRYWQFIAAQKALAEGESRDHQYLYAAQGRRRPSRANRRFGGGLRPQRCFRGRA